MSFILLTICVVVVGTVSVLVDRRWRAQQALQDATPGADASPAATAADLKSSATAVLSNVTERLASALRSVPVLGERLMRRQDPQLPEQFREWVAQACADDPLLHNWVQGLSEEGLQAFTEHLSMFCYEMGFELAWVVQQQLETQPALAETVARVVAHYCRACQQAAAVQDELDVYKTLQAFEQNPASRKTQAFGQKLFAKVVEAGLTSVSMSEYLIATPKEQQQCMVRAIREAARTNHAEFNRLLTEVVRHANPGSTTAQAATAQAHTSAEQEEGAPVSSFV